MSLLVINSKIVIFDSDEKHIGVIMANIDKNLISNFKRKGYTLTFYDSDGITEPKDATSVIIRNDEVSSDVFSIQLPKLKLVNYRWLNNQMNRRKSKATSIIKEGDLYEELLGLILKRLNATYLDTIYTTNRGFSFKPSINNIHIAIEGLVVKILEDNDVDYTKTISDSRKITQYTIGRARGNIKIIERVIKKYKI